MVKIIIKIIEFKIQFHKCYSHIHLSSILVGLLYWKETDWVMKSDCYTSE